MKFGFIDSGMAADFNNLVSMISVQVGQLLVSIFFPNAPAWSNFLKKLGAFFIPKRGKKRHPMGQKKACVIKRWRVKLFSCTIVGQRPLLVSEVMAYKKVYLQLSWKRNGNSFNQTFFPICQIVYYRKGTTEEAHNFKTNDIEFQLLIS